INVPAPKASITNTLGRLVERSSARIFGSHCVHLVAGRSPHHRVRSFPPGDTDCGGNSWCGSASGIAVFTSDMAIIGRNRMKIRNREVKIPIVPMYVQMSTQVGWKMRHEDGRKSRCNPPAIMIKRSNHMPAL